MNSTIRDSWKMPAGLWFIFAPVTFSSFRIQGNHLLPFNYIFDFWMAPYFKKSRPGRFVGLNDRIIIHWFRALNLIRDFKSLPILCFRRVEKKSQTFRREPKLPKLFFDSAHESFGANLQASVAGQRGRLRAPRRRYCSQPPQSPLQART